MITSSKIKKDDQFLTQKTKSSKKTFWSSFFSKLQDLGQALLYPIAVLPFAALLNRFGQLAIDLHPMVDGQRDAANWIGFIIQTPGKIVFDNLPLMFAIGTAFGFAKDHRGEVALVGALMYLILGASLADNALPSLLYKNVLQMDYWDVEKGEWAKGFSQLFYVPTYGQVLINGENQIVKTGGNYILNIGVIGGIISGATSAWAYNKFKGIKLPEYLSFFGGRRFVPMVIMLMVIPIAFAFAIVWPWIQYTLMQFGKVLSSGDAWAIPGGFLYGFINRILQPFGVHHILNTFLWFQLPIEGYVTDISGKIVLGSDVFKGDWNEIMNQLNDISRTWANPVVITPENYMNYFTFNANLLDPKAATQVLGLGGGKYSVFGDINAFQKSLVSGNFQTGFFPTFWGGLPAAALAMTMAAKKENRRKTGTFMIGVAIVCMLTGVDEPLFFAFTFVAPILWFYNALFTAIMSAIALSMHMHVGFGFSGGLIDYIISFTNSWGMSKYEGLVNGKAYGVLSNPLWMFALSGLMFGLYYTSFYFTIKKLNIKTPGREDEPVVAIQEEVLDLEKVENKYQAMAGAVLDIIGRENILKVSNCTTRLRLEVTDNQIGSDQDYKNVGAKGVVRIGTDKLQIIFGTDVEFVTNEIDKLLEVKV